jgi:hypothetical protein
MRYCIDQSWLQCGRKPWIFEISMMRMSSLLSPPACWRRRVRKSLSRLSLCRYCLIDDGYRLQIWYRKRHELSHCSYVLLITKTDHVFSSEWIRIRSVL